MAYVISGVHPTLCQVFIYLAHPTYITYVPVLQGHDALAHCSLRDMELNSHGTIYTIHLSQY